MPTVLIVDDDRTFGSEVGTALRARGIAADVAADGDSGLALLEGGGYAALLLDMVMPGVDGLQILDRARTSGGHAPVIVASAFLPSYLHDLLSYFPQVKLIAPKPVAPDVIASVLAAICDASVR